MNCVFDKILCFSVTIPAVHNPSAFAAKTAAAGEQGEKEYVVWMWQLI